MLKNKLKDYIEEELANQQGSNSVEPFQIELYKEEKSFLEKHSSIVQEIGKKVTLSEKVQDTRFNDVYIEKCNKETEDLISEESSTFLDQQIQYFQHHLEEFMYLESSWFDIIGVDAISFEMDSVFKTYDVMLGLKCQKKHEVKIKTFFSTNLISDKRNFEVMFNANEGIWDVNFSINSIKGFEEDWTIREAYNNVYHFLFQLREYIETER